MNLDDLNTIQRLDSQAMIDQLKQLPDQLDTAWALGQSLRLPPARGLARVVVAGMGGSAIGAELAAAYAAHACPIPITTLRQYDLPAWAQGPSTLVILSSHSGNTEETLSVFGQAHARSCQVVVVTTGGRLEELAREQGDIVWLFEHTGQPRTAVGFSFGLLVAAFYRLGLLPDPSNDLREMLDNLRIQQAGLLPEVPVAQNPAKRLAGQMMGRLVVVLAADYLEPVARRWKDQISEVAKSWAQFEALPEANHNTLAGLEHPENLLSQMIALFLTAPSNHPRNQLRLDLTRQWFMLQGINTDVVSASGKNLMAHSWSLIQQGDFITYYLAMANGEDPTPVEAISALKQELAKYP